MPCEFSKCFIIGDCLSYIAFFTLLQCLHSHLLSLLGTECSQIQLIIFLGRLLEVLGLFGMPDVILCGAEDGKRGIRDGYVNGIGERLHMT